MNSKKEVQHVYLVGAKSLGAYGGYETFVYKLTEYHQNKENIKYHVACKANGDGCMDESKFDGVTKINDHEFEFHNAHCFKIDVPQIGPAQAIYYDIAALKACCEHIKKNHIPHPIVYIMACRIGPFASHFYREIHKLGGTVYLNPDGHEWMRAKWSAPIRKYWKISEQMMVKYCDLAICDSVNIEKYIHECYDGKGIKGRNPKTTFIAYGADLTLSKLADDDEKLMNWYREKGLTKKDYYLVVGRFVPENSFEVMIREFMKSKSKKNFAIITNVNEKFLNELEEKLHFKSDKRIKFVGTVYDQELLKKIRENLELEKKLDEQIRQMESTHPGYDEYRYQLDEIGHDPYQLISHLTAVYEQFTRGQVKTVIKSLFEQQYLLKVWETIEIRTRMETRVGIRPTIDAFGNVSMETYTYQEEVEYEYKILNVLLKNKGFDTIARKNMDRKQTGRYDTYNLTYGNRPELFGAGSPTYSGGTTGSIGSGGSGGTGGRSGGGFQYDIPEEALSDEKFARMIAEAEKYLGMPYVWGGSSPSTSFDCSGFVCWVINNCGNGWNVGRTTANGLRGKCSYVSPANAQPGDLIFFEKTYNTVGASHVGIYVGNGMMIHCGDPISYTSINSTYWQNHFLGFGRIK